MWIPVIEPDDYHAVSHGLSPDIHVQEGRDPVPTDYFDPDGNRIYWVPERIGFHNPLGDQ